MIRRGTENDLAQVLGIVGSRPSHFVPASYPLIEADFRKLPSYVWENNGTLAGFIVWMNSASELELLWLAVDPEAAGAGIGGKLVDVAMSEVTTQHVILLKTASTDSEIPGTRFSGAAYKGTIEFFLRRGFREACRLESYWGPRNHCVILCRHVIGPT